MGGEGEVRTDCKASSSHDLLDGANKTGSRRNSKFDTGEVDGVCSGNTEVHVRCPLGVWMKDDLGWTFRFESLQHIEVIKVTGG